MERHVGARRRTERSVRRRALAILLVSGAFLASVAFWLSSSGAATSSISPPAGAPADGEVAEVTALSSSVTRTNGGAQLQTGVALAKLVTSKSAANHLRVEISWTNATQGVRVLNNPNAQISVGVYHPIHTGACNNASNSVDAPLVNVTDTDANSYCAALDAGTTGKFVSAAGKLLLAQNQISGYLLTSVDGSGSLSACASSGNDSDAWCRPASVSDVNQRVLFVIASIVTPGGIPQGQQPQLDSLDFYTDVRPAA
jgi:hypothetical protein